MNNFLSKALEPFEQVKWFGIAIVFFTLGTVILSFDVFFPSGDTFVLKANDIATEDIFAPEDITYISVERTEQERKVARDNPANDQYDPIENAKETQVALAQDIVDYIDDVHTNPYLSQEQKLNDLKAISELSNIDDQTWINFLTIISDSNPNREIGWDELQVEITAALGRTMDRSFSANEVNSQIVRISDNFSNFDTERAVVEAIVKELLAPTRIFNAEKTRESKEAAAAAVESVDFSYRRGQPIIEQGDVVDATHIEALRQYGLLQQTEDNFRFALGSLLMLMSITTVTSAYLYRFYPNTVNNPSMLILLAFLFLQFLGIGRIFGDEGLDQIRLFPAAAMALLLTTVVGAHLAAIASVGLAILMVGMLPDMSAVELVAQITIGSIAGILALGRSERQNAYFFAGIVIGLANAGVLVAVELTIGEDPNLISVIGQAVIAMTNGLFAAGIALVELYVITTAMNLPTSLKLIELMQPNQPLLQRLLREAPGTFQHSLQVANLAELATERIGGNATLVRVAAMYHDIGKTLNPHFFVENQKGINPHDILDDPQKSAKILISHVLEGDRIARRSRLPNRIRDFIREHHGTTKPFFYYKAVENADGDESKVDAANYTYPGPIPQSKETAILMLADGSESAARGIQPRTKEEVAGVVNMIFEKDLQEGQLDESGLTLNDLKVIREVFIETLQGVYHTRIAYPGQIDEKESKPVAKLAQPKVEDDETLDPADVMASATEDEIIAYEEGLMQTKELDPRKLPQRDKELPKTPEPATNNKSSVEKTAGNPQDGANGSVKTADDARKTSELSGDVIETAKKSQKQTDSKAPKRSTGTSKTVTPRLVQSDSDEKAPSQGEASSEDSDDE